MGFDDVIFGKLGAITFFNQISYVEPGQRIVGGVPGGRELYEYVLVGTNTYIVIKQSPHKFQTNRLRGLRLEQETHNANKTMKNMAEGLSELGLRRC